MLCAHVRKYYRWQAFLAHQQKRYLGEEFARQLALDEEVRAVKGTDITLVIASLQSYSSDSLSFVVEVKPAMEPAVSGSIFWKLIQSAGSFSAYRYPIGDAEKNMLDRTASDYIRPQYIMQPGDTAMLKLNSAGRITEIVGCHSIGLSAEPHGSKEFA